MLSLSFTHPATNLKTDVEKALEILIDTMPNKGIISENNKQIIFDLIGINPQWTSVDYGYLGPIVYRTDSVQCQYFIAIMSSEDEGDTNSSFTNLSIASVALHDGTHDIETVRSKNPLFLDPGSGDSAYYNLIYYKKYLERMQAAIPDQELQGIIDI